MDILKLRGISLFIIAFANLILALILWQEAKKNRANFWLALAALFSGFYAFFCGGTYFFWKSESMLSVYWYRTTWLGVLLLPPFVTFTYYFTQRIKNLKFKISLLYLGAIIISFLAFATTLFVKSVYLRYPHISSLAGPLDSWGRLFILLCVIIVLVNLLRDFFQSTGFKRLQLQYFILGVSIFAFTGIVSAGIIPILIKESPYYDFTAYSSFFWVGLTSYAIIKRKLFDIKVILTTLLVVIIAFLLLFNLLIFTEKLPLQIFKGIILASFLFLGPLLIRSVLREVEQREKLEVLTKTLEAANEKLKQLDKLKSEFLSFAAHQVKSPMTIVKGYATLIADGTLGEASKEVKETAEKIKNSADRLISLVNNLLDLRKIEEGRMEFNFEEKNLIEVVKSIVEELRPLAQDKKLELSFESKDNEIKVDLDVQKFSQVIQNLIDNAIKYTEKGWIRINVKCQMSNVKNKNEVLITVADSGRGISKELMPKMFEQFSRDSSAKKEIQGTGLGLYIAKQIVLGHQGQIWAESEGEGEGSRFMVKLPFA